MLDALPGNDPVVNKRSNGYPFLLLAYLDEQVLIRMSLRRVPEVAMLRGHKEMC